MKKRLLSILLCLALVAGVLPLAAPAVFAQENDIANGDYSSWNKAYVATDSGGLEKVFNKERTKDTTVYIKLGKDISYSGLDDDIFNRSGLSAKGGDIHLDLCGYNLTYSKDFNFIKGDTGRVYIYDSQRYDQSKGKWISGKVQQNTAHRSVLIGRITVYGGTFVNGSRTEYSSMFRLPACVYCGNEIKIYGGEFEADCPVIITKSTYEDYADCGIYGGTLRVKGSPYETKPSMAIFLKLDNITYGEKLPDMEKCHIINASDREKIDVFNVGLPADFDDTHNFQEALEYTKNIVHEEVRFYIDGVLQSEGVNGISYIGGAFQGPAFASECVFTAVSVVNRIEVTIPEPKAGNHNFYLADALPGTDYEIDKRYESNYQHNGVMWYDAGSANASLVSSPFTFTVGKTYTVAISVKVKEEYVDMLAAMGKIKGIVNGKEVFVVRDSDTTCTLNYTFTVEKAAVTEIPVKVTAPAAGEKVSYQASVSSLVKGVAVADMDAGPYKNGVMWQHGMETLDPGSTEYFSPGDIYYLSVLVELTDDSTYKFAAPEDITATVNGDHDTSVHDEGNGCYRIDYTFTVGMEKIKYVEITVPGINPGAKIPYTAEVPDGKGYKVRKISNLSVNILNGFIWWHNGEEIDPEAGETFIPGDEYTVTIYLQVTDGDRYEFADKNDVTAEINGATAKYAALNDVNAVNYTFTAPSIYTVENIDIALPGIAVGARIPYTAEWLWSKGYAVEDLTSGVWKNGIRWRIVKAIDPAEEATFLAGQSYTVSVSVVLTDEERFRFAAADKINATINGVPARVSELEENNYLVFITIEMPANVPGDLDGDGEVTDQDAVYLLFHTFYPEDYPVTGSVDYDGDGEVTDQDAVYLLFYTFYPEDYPI